MLGAHSVGGTRERETAAAPLDEIVVTGAAGGERRHSIGNSVVA